MRGLAQACTAELLDAEVLVRALHAGDRAQRRGDAIHRLHHVAADIELHQRRVSVTGDEHRAAVAKRRADVGDPALR